MPRFAADGIAGGVVSRDAGVGATTVNPDAGPLARRGNIPRSAPR